MIAVPWLAKLYFVCLCYICSATFISIHSIGLGPSVYLNSKLTNVFTIWRYPVSHTSLDKLYLTNTTHHNI